MYLTRLDLNMRDRSVRRLMGNEERIHAMLCRVFDSSRTEGRILYRVALDARRQAIYVYSREAVDHSRLPAGVSVHGDRNLTEWLNSLHDGDVCRFDLVAVPSKKVHRDNAKHSSRVVLKTLEERAAWLQRKAKTSGFELLSFTEEEERATYAYQQSHGRNSFQMSGVRFTGVLRITDVARFRETLADGVGAQRAYGYGMMLVKRA